MSFITILRRFYYNIGYAIYYFYWFLFRPSMEGVQIIIKCGNDFFLVQHSYKNFGKWDFVGGGRKRGETPEETMLRELKEETGLKPSEWKYVGFVSIYADFHTSNVHVYEIETLSKDIVLDKGEILNGKWSVRDEVENGLSTFSKIQWQKYLFLKRE